MSLSNFAAGGPTQSEPILTDEDLVKCLFEIISTADLDVDAFDFS